MRNLINIPNYFYLFLAVVRFFYFSTIFLFYINYKLILLYLLEWRKHYGLYNFVIVHYFFFIGKLGNSARTQLLKFLYKTYNFTSFYILILTKNLLSYYYITLLTSLSYFKITYLLHCRLSSLTSEFWFFFCTFSFNLMHVKKLKHYFFKFIKFFPLILIFLLCFGFFFCVFIVFVNLDFSAFGLYLTKCLVSFFVWCIKTPVFYYNYFLLSWLNNPLENYFVWSSFEFMEEVREAGEGEAWLKSLHAAGFAASLRYQLAYFFGSLLPILVFYYQVFEIYFYHNFLQSNFSILHVEPTLYRLILTDLVPLSENLSFRLLWIDQLWFNEKFLFLTHHIFIPNLPTFIWDGGLVLPFYSCVENNSYNFSYDALFYFFRFFFLYINDTLLYCYIFTYNFTDLASYISYLLKFVICLQFFVQYSWTLLLGSVSSLFIFLDCYDLSWFNIIENQLCLLFLFLYKTFHCLLLAAFLIGLKLFHTPFVFCYFLLNAICTFFTKLEFNIIAIFYTSHFFLNSPKPFDALFILLLLRLLIKSLFFLASAYLTFLLLVFHSFLDYLFMVLGLVLSFFGLGIINFSLLLMDFFLFFLDFFNLFDNLAPFTFLSYVKLRFTSFINILIPTFTYYSIFNLNFIPYYISLVLILILIYNVRFLNRAFSPGRKHAFSLFFIRNLYFRSWFRDKNLFSDHNNARLNYLYFNFENFLVAHTLSESLNLDYLSVFSPTTSATSFLKDRNLINFHSSTLLASNSTRIKKITDKEKLYLVVCKFFRHLELKLISYYLADGSVTRPTQPFLKLSSEIWLVLKDYMSLTIFSFAFAKLKFYFFSSFGDIFSNLFSRPKIDPNYFSSLGLASTMISTISLFFISFADIFYWFSEKNILQLQLQERVSNFFFFSNTHPTASALFSDLFYDKMTFNTRFVTEFFDNTTFWLKFNHNFSTPRIFLHKYLKQIDKKIFPLQVDIGRLDSKRPWISDSLNPLHTGHFSPSMEDKKRLALPLMRLSEFNYLMFEIFFLTYRDKAEDFPKISSFKYWKDSYDTVVELLLMNRYFESGDLVDPWDFYTIFTQTFSDYLMSFNFQFFFHGIIFPFYKSWSMVEGKLESMFNHNQIMREYIFNYVAPFNFFQKRSLMKRKNLLEKVEPNEMFREWIDMNPGMYNSAAKAVRIRTPVASIFRRQVRAKAFWEQADHRYQKRINIYRAFEEISSFPLVFTVLEDDLHFRRIIDTFNLDSNLSHPKKYWEVGKINRNPLFWREKDKHLFEEFGWIVENTTGFWSTGEAKRKRWLMTHKLHPWTDYEFWTDPINLYQELLSQFYFAAEDFTNRLYRFKDLMIENTFDKALDPRYNSREVSDFDPLNTVVAAKAGVKKKDYYKHYFTEKNFSPPLSRLNPISPNYHYNIPLSGGNDVFRTPLSHMIFLYSAVNTPFNLQRHNFYMEILDFYKIYFGYPEFLTDNWIGTSSYTNESDRRYQDDNPPFRFDELENPYIVKMLKTGKFHAFKPWHKYYRPFYNAPQPKWVKWRKSAERREFLNSNLIPDWIPNYWQQLDWVKDLSSSLKYIRETRLREEDLEHFKPHLPAIWEDLRFINNKSVAFNLDGTINALSHINFEHRFDSFFFDSMSKLDNWILSIFSDLFINNIINLYLLPCRELFYWFFSIIFQYRYQLFTPQFKSFYDNRYIFSFFNEFAEHHSSYYWYRLFLVDKFIFILSSVKDLESMVPELIWERRFSIYNAFYNLPSSEDSLDETICGFTVYLDQEYYDYWINFDDFCDEYYYKYQMAFGEDAPYDGPYWYDEEWGGWYIDDEFDMYEEIFLPDTFDETFEITSQDLELLEDEEFNILESFIASNGLLFTSDEMTVLNFIEADLSLRYLPDPDFLNVSLYDKSGYDEFGYDIEGYDKLGYDFYGYNEIGYDVEGYNMIGSDKYGYDREGNHVFVFTRF